MDPFAMPAQVGEVITRLLLVTIGISPDKVTRTLWLLVQPLTGFVTTTVYVPRALTTGFCTLVVKPPGPIQENIAPAVVEEAVSIAVGWLHMIVPPVAVRSGILTSQITTTVAVLVQPLTELITVTVY